MDTIALNIARSSKVVLSPKVPFHFLLQPSNEYISIRKNMICYILQKFVFLIICIRQSSCSLCDNLLVMVRDSLMVHANYAFICTFRIGLTVNGTLCDVINRPHMLTLCARITDDFEIQVSTDLTISLEQFIKLSYVMWTEIQRKHLL
jgi:hypothetical protein